ARVAARGDGAQRAATPLTRAEAVMDVRDVTRPPRRVLSRAAADRSQSDRGDDDLARRGRGAALRVDSEERRVGAGALVMIPSGASSRPQPRPRAVVLRDDLRAAGILTDQ